MAGKNLILDLVRIGGNEKGLLELIQTKS